MNLPLNPSTLSDDSRRPAARALALIAALCVTLLAVGCTTNDATGRSQLLAFDRGEEVAIGEEAMPQLIAEYGGEVPDASLRTYVADVGYSMVPFTESDNPSLPWEFTLLDSDVINAFALPGGKVFMSRGLAEAMTNEAQLAGVLGHEIGHVTARHTSERVGHSMGVQVLAGIVGAVAGYSSSQIVAQAVPEIVGAGGQGYLLKYGRDQELEADRLGMRYMVRAGYDPIGLKQTMEILAAAAGAGGQPEFLSTHPHPESRVKQANKIIARDYAETQNNPEYGTFESRFRDRFLSVVATLPPARHGPARSGPNGRMPIAAYALAAHQPHQHYDGPVDFNDPSSWCAFCRER
ncbi:MAG: M48 family metalloprotease [Planctomycetota bacterium]